MWRSLREDIQALHAYRDPGAPARPGTMLRLGLSSRGLWLLTMQRLDHRAECYRPAGLVGRCWRFGLKAAGRLGMWTMLILTKSDILPAASFENGVVLSDRGHIILGARAVGRGSVIQHHVTVGIDLTHAMLPEIGRDVWIGPYCVVYGNIRIGDGATILPHSVVSRSVPPGCVVHGNPAVPVRPQPDPEVLRRSLRGGEAPAPDLPAAQPDVSSS